MARPHVLLVGDDKHLEFREAVAWLDAHSQLRRARTVEAAIRTLNPEAPPLEAIVFAQSRPGVFPQEQVEKLHARTPLSRLVALLGSWCEGESRTGRPWPGVVRVYWHQWLAQCRRELAAGLHHGPSTWRLPRTATDAEQLLVASRQPPPQGRGLIVIHADRRATFDCLADACQSAGYSSVWLAAGQAARVQAPAAVLWDGDLSDRRQLEHVRSLAAALRPAPLVALVDAVRLDDQQRALASGVAVVVAKPFLLADLFGQLHHLLKAAPNPPAAIPRA